ncbi:hypothetical protein K9L16_01740 [Candidatus Pacearchaeota archaeon]|nr:hypothetical protein [Candidatus Pacearchaeota archaeon]
MIGAYNLLFNNPSSEKDFSDRDNDQKFLRKKPETLEEKSYDLLPCSLKIF